MESAGITDLVVKLKPRTLQGGDPADRALPARAARLGHGRADYVARKHGLTRVEYLVPELAGAARRDARRDRLPGSGAPDREPPRGLQPRRRRPAAARDGQEEARGDGEAPRQFVSGCARNGIDATKAETLFDLIAEFAGYGFPKAHSTAYAFLTYQTAYLKANHPRAFFAALLSIESGNHDKLARYIAHAREHKIEVLPPDVNESARDFTPVADGHPLRARGREERGRGRDRVDPRGARGGRPVRRPLRLRAARRRPPGEPARRREPGEVRRLRLAAREPRGGVERARRGARAGRVRAARPRARPGEPLRRALAGRCGRRAARCPRRRPGRDAERLAGEKEVLGFYVTGHPLEAFAPRARAAGRTSAPARRPRRCRARCARAA